MLRLKLLTTTFVVFSIALMVGYPWLLGPRPVGPSHAREYVLRALIYVAAVLAALIGAGIFSILILRRAREEYRLEKERLLKQLLEASLEEHRHKPEDAQ